MLNKEIINLKKKNEGLLSFFENTQEKVNDEKSLPSSKWVSSVNKSQGSNSNISKT